jgi:hypothetical protein
MVAREADTEPKPQKAQRRGFTRMHEKETDNTTEAGVAEARLMLHCAASMELPSVTFEEPTSSICKTELKPAGDGICIKNYVTVACT